VYFDPRVWFFVLLYFLAKKDFRLAGGARPIVQPVAVPALAFEPSGSGSLSASPGPPA
jgi:hypothetical protein